MQEPLSTHPLTQAREAKNLTQKELAEKIRVSARTIWAAEHNQPVGAYVRRRLCNYFKKTAQELGLVADSKETEPTASLEQIQGTESVDGNQERLPQLSQAIAEGIILAVRELGGQDMDTLRRQLLSAVGAAIITPTGGFIDTSIIERLSRVLAKPSSIDEKTLQYLAARTASHWRDYNERTLPAYDLLNYVAAHLQKIVNLLEGPLLPASRLQLCGIASETALLVGVLHFDLGAYAQARVFQKAAIRAAQEASFQELEAVCWGWMSFTWTYSGQYQEALDCIQQGRSLAEGRANMAVCAWLAAVEAEVQANLHHQKACLSALDEAEHIQNAKEQHYYADFDHLRLLGYKGVCLQLLYSPEDTSTLTFLTQAQQSLKEALALINPALLGWQCGMHTDLAGTYARQGILEKAYTHATQALTLISHIKSYTEVQRLRTLRRTLEPWRDTQYVKDLDAQMAPLLVAGWNRGSA